MKTHGLSPVSGSTEAAGVTGAGIPALERHFSVHEVAEMWGLSSEKVRRMFQDFPGVLKIGFPGILPGRKRPHITLRIPASVLTRFHEDRSGGFPREVQSRRRAV